MFFFFLWEEKRFLCEDSRKKLDPFRFFHNCGILLYDNKRGMFMWKYQCKKQLFYILLGAVAGAIIFGLLGYEHDMIKETLKVYTDDPAIINNALIPYITGAITFAGIINGINLFFLVMQRFNLSFFVTFLILMLGGGEIAIVAGTIGLPICIIIYLYGWITVPNRGKKRQLNKDSLNSVKEIERVFRLHHKYDEQYEEIAGKIWKNMLIANVLYIIGALASLLVFVYVKNTMVVLLCMMLYFMLVFQITKRKSMMLQPIVSLLYDQCDPLACASAIFALAHKSHRKKNFPLIQQMAQCMIYLDDPHLAVDIMASGNMQNKNGLQYAYHSLMAYAYYQLGDKGMVQHHFDESEKLPIRNMNGPLGIIRLQTLTAIQNKLSLMEQDFDKAEQFYKGLLSSAGFRFQKVDANYYLGLIAFVQKDIYVAARHFTMVIEQGNTMFFVNKAKEFMRSIERVEKAEEA